MRRETAKTSTDSPAADIAPGSIPPPVNFAAAIPDTAAASANAAYPRYTVSFDGSGDEYAASARIGMSTAAAPIPTAVPFKSASASLDASEPSFFALFIKNLRR